MNLPRIRRVAPVTASVVALLVLGLAACGDDGNDATDSTTETSTSDTTNTTDGSEDTTEDTTESTDDSAGTDDTTEDTDDPAGTVDTGAPRPPGRVTAGHRPPRRTSSLPPHRPSASRTP